PHLSPTSLPDPLPISTLPVGGPVAIIGTADEPIDALLAEARSGSFTTETRRHGEGNGMGREDEGASLNAAVTPSLPHSLTLSSRSEEHTSEIQSRFDL